MGHQHHFLSRLDRVTAVQLEIALHLYQDPDLVRRLLAHVHIPEEAERVAISLAHPARGPFVIVTCGGLFVTCLGDGMGPGHCCVITRKELDAFAALPRVQRASRKEERGTRPRRAMAQPWERERRNGRCPCGSGSRYEQCCAEAA